METSCENAAGMVLSAHPHFASARLLAAFALACALAIACAFCPAVPHGQAHALAAPSNSGALVVKGGKLTSAKTGKTVVLRGVSLHGLAWFPQYVNAKSFKALRRSWKANVVRLPLYTAEYGGYCTGGDKSRLLKLVDDGVRHATENDLYVIIDWHTLSDGNPNAYVKTAKKFFKKVAKRYRNHVNVLYEICNEPNAGTSWEQVRAYAAKVIPVIRRYDKDAIILLGTPEWCQRIDQAAAAPLAKRLSRNVMYTFHFYAGTHKAVLRTRLQKALKEKTPVFVSEYGISDASGDGKLNKTQGRKWLRLLTKYKVSRCAWNLSDKDESSAMLKSGYGVASDLVPEDLKPSGKWVRTALRAGW